MNKHHLIAWFRFLFCLFIVSESSACAPYLTKKDLHAMNPSAEIIDVCVRTPTLPRSSGIRETATPFAPFVRSARPSGIKIPLYAIEVRTKCGLCIIVQV